MKEVCLFLLSLLTFAVADYIFCQVNEQTYQMKKKNIISILFISVFWMVMEKYASIPRPCVIVVSSTIMFSYLYHKSLSKTILTVLIIFILMMIAETAFMIAFVYLLNIDTDFFEFNVLGVFLVNFTTIVLITIFSSINVIKKLMINIIAWYSEKALLRFLITVIIAFTIIAYFTYLNYIGAQSILYVIGINVILIAIYIFVIGFFKEHAENNKLLIEYDRQMIYVKTYEKLAHDKQKEQHEYRNQLSLIRSMVESKDKKTLSYIDKLLEIDLQNQSHQYFEQLTHIPSGGLKGFILFKINEMIDYGIEVVVNVEEELKNEKYWKVCDNELTDISRAIGVYMDNAKEAASLAKQKFFIIDVTVEDETLIFSFSNTFAGEIDLLKIGQQGYSTKGIGHGNGLSLINDIISKNKHLTQSRQINGIYYVQNLMIK